MTQGMEGWSRLGFQVEGWNLSVTAGWRIEKPQGPAGQMERFWTVAAPLRFATKLITDLGRPKSE